MNWRSVTALLVIAFIAGGAGIAWLSSTTTLPWEDAKAQVLPAAPVAPPTLATPVGATLVLPSASQAESMLLVLSARRAIETGKPLGELGNRLQASFGQNQPRAVATIAQATQRPVSNASLLASLDAIAPKLVLPVGSSWDRIQYEAATLFVIRSAAAKPKLTETRMAKARDAIIAGDVAEAARIVRTLPGAANAKDWLIQANHAIAVHQALDTLSGAALATSAPPLPTPSATTSEQISPANGE
jgi:hypothetical protein